MNNLVPIAFLRYKRKGKKFLTKKFSLEEVAKTPQKRAHTYSERNHYKIYKDCESRK